MRWPFGPHLSFKPSKEKTKQNKQKQKKQKQKKKTKIPKKELSAISIFSFWWVSKISLLLTTWTKKHTAKKTIKQQSIFEKQISVTKRPFLEKKPNPEIPVIIVFVSFFLFQQQKTQQLAETLFYSVLATKKRDIPKARLKTEKFGKRHIAPFFEKPTFRELADNWAQKTHKMITEQKNRLKPL